MIIYLEQNKLIFLCILCRRPMFRVTGGTKMKKIIFSGIGLAAAVIIPVSIFMTAPSEDVQNLDIPETQSLGDGGLTGDVIPSVEGETDTSVFAPIASEQPINAPEELTLVSPQSGDVAETIIPLEDIEVEVPVESELTLAPVNDVSEAGEGDTVDTLAPSEEILPEPMESIEFEMPSVPEFEDQGYDEGLGANLTEDMGQFETNMDSDLNDFSISPEDIPSEEYPDEMMSEDISDTLSDLSAPIAQESFDENLVSEFDKKELAFSSFVYLVPVIMSLGNTYQPLIDSALEKGDQTTATNLRQEMAMETRSAIENTPDISFEQYVEMAQRVVNDSEFEQTVMNSLN
jgi:hypothetical protein